MLDRNPTLRQSRRKPNTFIRVKTVDGFYQADDPILEKVLPRQARSFQAPQNSPNEIQMRVHDPVARALVALVAPSQGKVPLLLRREPGDGP